MKLQLNFNKPDNYAFFCPVSKVHLTRSNPVAFVNGVTPYIERGLKSKAILEIAEDITGQKASTKAKSEPVQEVKKPEEQKESIPSVEEKVVDTVEETKEETAKVESEPIQQKAPAPSEKPKKGRQKKA
jgi:hypothetical protein